MREGPQGTDGASQSDKADVPLKKKNKQKNTEGLARFFSSGNKSGSLAGVFAPSAASGAAARLGDASLGLRHMSALSLPLFLGP